MKDLLVKVLATLILFVPSFCFANNQVGEGPTLQIVLENNEPMIINAAGEKKKFTLDSLMSSAIEAGYPDAKITPKDKLDPKAIIYIRIEKINGKPRITLFDNHNRAEPLDLGVFIAAAAQTYPGCNAQQINGKSITINLNFKTNTLGNTQTFYTRTDGKEVPFNLGVLLADTTLALNDCK